MRHLNCNNPTSDKTESCKKCDEKIKTTGKSNVWVIVIVAFIVSAVVGYAIYYQSEPEKTEVKSATETPQQVDNAITSEVSQSEPEKTEVIASIVREAKALAELPQQIDEFTVWNDIVAHSDSIRFHYTLSGEGVNDLSSDNLKNILQPALCNNQATRQILNQEISMEYSYNVSDPEKNYFFSITESDCL